MQTRRLFTLARHFIAETSAGSDRRIVALLLVSGSLLGACGGDSAASPGVGGSGGAMSGAGGSPGTGGTGGASTSGSGGRSGSGGASGAITDNPEFGLKIPCPPPTQALILSFAPAGGGPSADAGGADAAAPAPVRDASFGTYGVTFAGGTFYYPADGAWPIESNVAQGNWHMTGDVGTYSGFGIYIVACNVLDASAFDGISFTISGSVAMGNAIDMFVATSANEVSHVWINTVSMPTPATPAAVNSGRCIPASTNQFDGSCAAASVSVPVTAEPVDVTVLWSQLTGGRPTASVDPTEILGIFWAFPAPPGAGTATPFPYPIDIVIDDIGFVDNP